MRRFIPFIISISLFYNAFVYDLGVVHIAFAVISSFLSLIYFSQINWIHRLPSLTILLYCYLSTAFLSFSHLVPPIWTETDLMRIARLGSNIYCVAILSISFIDLLFQKRYKNRYNNQMISSYFISTKQVTFFFILSYALSIISYILGVSVMGAESTVLPFHLSGVLHGYRTVFAPLFFMLIVENRLLNKRNVPRKWYLLFTIWCLFEAFLRISKSFFVFGLMPVGIFLFFYYRPSFKKLLVYMAPFTITALFLYAIMGAMRGSSGATIAGLQEAQKIQSSNETSEEWGNPLVGSFNRMFMTGMAYRIDYDAFNHVDLFDFSSAPAIIVLGGTARYRTYFLHGQQEGRHNSDGTTGIIDPLLWGGFGFCYIILFLLIASAIYTERHTGGRRLGLLVSFSLLFFSLITDGTVSWILSQNESSLLITRLIVIFILIKINYGYKNQNNKLQRINVVSV